MTEDIALAHANFRLGWFLLKSGRAEEADGLPQEASRPHPQPWNMWRHWSTPMNTCIASSPAFGKRVNGLDKGKYYPLPDIAAMPE